MGIEDLVVSEDAQMGLGNGGRARLLELLQVTPIVPDAGIPGKPLHVDAANGVPADSQPLDDLQQADSLENDLPMRSGRPVQGITKGCQIEPIHIVRTSTSSHHMTVCADETCIKGIRELLRKEGLPSPTKPVDTDHPSLSESQTDLTHKGIDIREELYVARASRMTGFVKSHAPFQ